MNDKLLNTKQNGLREFYTTLSNFNGHYDHWSMLMENFHRFKD